jgi:hypothetical protein
MNAKTLAVALILVTSTAGAQSYIDEVAQPYYRQSQPYYSQSQVQIIDTQRTGPNSSTTTVIGDPRGFQMYEQSGGMTMRIGPGEGPRMWIQNGNMVQQFGGNYRQW